MGLTEQNQKLMAILPLIGASISILFCIQIIRTVLRSAYFRSRIYQRLMAACAFNVIIQSINIAWGPFMVPAGTPDFPYARGTIATCSATGFLGAFVTVVPNYFLAIYVLAFLGVKSKFHAQKNQWVEKWIHMIVYTLPIGRATYLLAYDAFNPIARSCTLASIPLGCGDKFQDTPDYQPCTRGPENIAELQWFVIGLPSLLTMILPTLMMLIMYVRLRHEPVVASVLKQSALFFFVGIYWTLFFSATDYAIISVKGKIIPTTNILAWVIRSLQGVWVYIVYWYFSSQDPMQPTRSSILGSAVTRLSSSAAGSRLSAIRPSFSIFDGAQVADSSSPWAKYLVDEGEDASYQDGYEYDDTDYDYGAGAGDLNIDFHDAKPGPKKEPTDRTLDITSEEFTVNPR